VAGGNGGTASGGQAGTGGSPSVACSTLTRTGDPVQVSHDDESGYPTLVRTGSGATVVYRRPAPGPTLGFQVQYPSWSDPWTGSWTKPTPAATAIEDVAQNYDYSIRAARGPLDGEVVVLHGASDNSCLALRRPLPDHASLASFPCPPPLFTFGPNPADVFAGPATPTGGESYLIAHQTGWGGISPTNYQINFAHVDLPTGLPPGSVSSFFDSLGCATAPVFARGWYSPSAGYLVAFTTSRPFLHCQLDQFADGPPNRLQIVSFGPSGDLTKDPELVHEEVLSTSILSLELAVRADGRAWLTFQTNLAGASAAAPGSLQALALDATGKPSNGLKSLVTQSTGLGPGTPASYAVTALGNRLVLAGSFAPQCAGSVCPALQIYVVDENTPDNPPPAYVSDLSTVMLGAPISLLGSADGSRLLVAYSDFTNNPTDVWAERYECVP
jgi:hypothetical protein